MFRTIAVAALLLMAANPLAAVFLGLPTAEAASVAQSTFDVDADNWGLFNAHPNAILIYHPTGGNPGGNISINGGSGNWFFSAPSKFLGNVSSAYQQTLTFDLRSGVGFVSTNRSLIIEGGGLTLSIGIPIPNLSFANYVVPLDETLGSWRLAGTIQTPTSQQMMSVLSSLDAIYIPGAFSGNIQPGGTSWLDNVVLNGADVPAVVPLPAALPLFLAALSGLGFFGWRRRRAVAA